MPTRKELIKQCRYYKGEDESPWEGVDQDKDALWFYESCWASSGDDKHMIDEYCYAGLSYGQRQHSSVITSSDF